MRLKRKERTGENEREHPFEESAAPERDALAIDPPTVESGAPDAPSEDGAGHLAPWIPPPEYGPEAWLPRQLSTVDADPVRLSSSAVHAPHYDTGMADPSEELAEPEPDAKSVRDEPDPRIEHPRRRLLRRRRRRPSETPSENPADAVVGVEDEPDAEGLPSEPVEPAPRRRLLRKRRTRSAEPQREDAAEAEPPARDADAEIDADDFRDGPAEPVEPRRRRRLLRRQRPGPTETPADDPPAPLDEDDTPAVECCDLVKRFGQGEASVEALRNISLHFEPRTFSAIMGPSGSGKSTLMHVLAGLEAPTSGTVRIGGIALDGLNERRRTALRRARVGFVFQAFNLLPVLSAQENIELPLRVAGVKPDRAWVEELLGAFDLIDRRGHRPAELSGGQQQRVAIARALVTQPNVVFADEPTGNIDSVAGEEVLGILERCVVDYGQTVVMVTHDPLAAAHAGRVVFLADGEIVGDERAPTMRRILDAVRERG